MTRLIPATLAVLLAVASLGVRAADTRSPEELVRSTTDEILALTKKNKELYQRDHQALYRMADERVLPYFDFRRMSQWVLGKHWRDASAAQRDRFVVEFRNLLVRTYSTALLSYTDQQILYLPSPARVADDDATVKTEVKQSGGAPNIPIHYSFFKNKSGEWKVYDVTIEGVSLVTNYRSVYATKIRNEGVEALIASMATDTRERAK